MPPKNSYRITEMPQFYRINTRIALFLTLFFTQTLSLASEGYRYEDEYSLKLQRQVFLQAEKALEKNSLDTYEILAGRLTSYPLYPYLEHKRALKSDLTNQHNVDALLKQYDGLPFQASIRGRWLDYLASQNQWQTYLQYYQRGMGERRYCQYLDAKWDALQSNPAQLKKHAKEVGKYWLSGASRHESCDPAFKKWADAGYKTQNMIWSRISKTIKSKDDTLTDYLKKSLSSQNQQVVDIWKTLQQNPSKLDSYLALPSKNGHSSRVIINSLHRLAWRTPNLAIQYLKTLQPKYNLDAAAVAKLNTTIALSLAVDNDPNAEKWISQIPLEQQSEQTKEWRVRAALRQQQWPLVESYIHHLSSKTQKESTWQYWLGIAEINNGKAKEGRARLAGIAAQRHYYGFLAAQFLGRPPSLNNQDLSLQASTLTKYAYMPEVRRSYELLQLGRTHSARREWNNALNKTSKVDRKYLASLAHGWGWHDRAINTLAQSKSRNALTQRFPTAYKDLVVKYSAENNLDPDWVYAIIRQESAFIFDAKSHVGAMGLMQLMPGTAKLVLKMLDQKWEGIQAILKPEKNIELGTRYLSSLNDELLHFTMATAAYNAGPHRVVKWIPKNKALPLSIWIETIPFKETRHYVKNVVAYRVIYSHFLGNSTQFLDQISKATIFELEQLKNAAQVAEHSQTLR